jgi:hypothetical protein
MRSKSWTGDLTVTDRFCRERVAICICLFTWQDGTHYSASLVGVRGVVRPDSGQLVWQGSQL